ncbi:MAG TPA: zinc-dependent peptidase [Saprospiraceae bacterium]|nr:zinc-dependent peptidase [Saprospiraceae bacterium]HQW57272.1 zinc-dependent peptidase [Saprospiraceae bacterium]
MRLTGILYLLSFLLALVIVGYSYTQTGDFLSLYLAIPAVIVSSTYMLGPQINFWWSKRNPPRLEPKVQRIFELYHPWYKNLDPKEKKLFNSRVVLYVEDKAWINMGIEEELPYDISAMIAFQAVRLTLSQNDFLMRPFDRIVVYPYPFLSPNYASFYHATETNMEDGALIFSMRHLIPAFQQPEKYFNIVLYEYARVFKVTMPGINYPEVDTIEFWQDLYRVANYSFKEIHGLIGIPDAVDAWGVAVHHYFTYGPHFARVFPELNDQLTSIFKIYNLST